MRARREGADLALHPQQAGRRAGGGADHVRGGLDLGAQRELLQLGRVQRPEQVASEDQVDSRHMPELVPAGAAAEQAAEVILAAREGLLARTGSSGDRRVVETDEPVWDEGRVSRVRG